MADEAVIRIKLEGGEEAAAEGGGGLAAPGGPRAPRSKNPAVARALEASKMRGRLAGDPVMAQLHGYGGITLEQEKHFKRLGIERGERMALGAKRWGRGRLAGALASRAGGISQAGGMLANAGGSLFGAETGMALGRAAGAATAIVGAAASLPELVAIARRIFSPEVMGQVNIGGLPLDAVLTSVGKAAVELQASAKATISTPFALLGEATALSEAGIRMTGGIAKTVAGLEKFRAQQAGYMQQARNIDIIQGAKIDREAVRAMLDGMTQEPDAFLRAIKAALGSAGSALGIG